MLHHRRRRMSTPTTMRRGIDGLPDLNRPPVMNPMHTYLISFDEFLDWCDEDIRAEWVNGRVVLLSPDLIPHDDLIEFLSRVIGIYAEHRSLGKVFTRTIL